MNLLALAIGLASTVPLTYQSDTLRWSRPTCSSCRLALRSEIRIQDERFNGDANGITIARLSNGAVVFADADAPEPLLLLRTPAGRVISVGRTGEGPGEYKSIRAVIAAPGDSLILFDATLARASWFDSFGRFSRSVSVRGFISGVTVLAHGSLLLNAGTVAREFAGETLVEIESSGRVVKLWRDLNPLMALRLSPIRHRRLLATDDGGAWVQLLRWKPVLERRDSSGRVQFVVLAARESLRESRLGTPISGDPSTGRPPEFAGFGLGRLNDSLGIALWHVQDPNWRRGYGPRRDGPEGPYHPVVSRDRVWDTWVDVFRMDTGELVASRRYDELYYGVTADGLFVRNADEDELHPYTELFRLSITREEAR